MPVAKLNKGYSISEGRRSGGTRMKLLRWAFIGFSAFIIVSVCLAIGYISRLSLESSYVGAGRASRTKREKTSIPIEEEEVNYMYQFFPQKDDGLEFNGLVHYDIPSVTDTANGGIAFWFIYPAHTTKDYMYLAGNREITCLKEDGKGYALYLDTITKKLHLVWRSKGDKNHDELVTSGRLREDRWNHIVLNFNRSKKANEEGGFITTIEIYINNALAFLRREVRYPAGVHAFSIGASPYHTNSFVGRIYNVMISKTPFTENQIATIYENKKQNVKQLHSLCQGIYLLKGEQASVREKKKEEKNIAELDVIEEKPKKKQEKVNEVLQGLEEEIAEEKRKRKKPKKESKKVDDLKKPKKPVKESKEVKQEKPKAPVDIDQLELEEIKKIHEEVAIQKSEPPKQSEHPKQTEKPQEPEQPQQPQQPEQSVDTKKVPTVSKNPHAEDLMKNYMSRSPFTPMKTVTNSLRSESASNIRPPPNEQDEMCSLIPPAPLPVLSGEIERFVKELNNVSPDEVKNGNFLYSVPENIHDEYHYLSEYRAKNVRDAFCFGWAGYREFAWGADEVHPISGGAGNNWGGFGMTILDSVDTLEIMGLHKEFDKATEWVREKSDFDRDHSVSVFETNIRVVGGMLAAYDLTKNELFLDKAADMADRLLPAFNTKSGYPKSAINLKTGYATVPTWTGNNVILAELGTMSLEFLYLAKHKNNKKYSAVIDKLYATLANTNTFDGLLPIFLSPISGEAKGGAFSMGASSDSYYEYLLKTWIQGGKKNETLRRLYNEAVDGMTKRLFRRTPTGLLYCGEENSGHFKPEMGHLTCFIGGMLALGVFHGVNPATAERDLANAKAFGYTCYRMYKDSPTGVSGEGMMANSEKFIVNSRAPYYILRPEAIESLYYLNQITGDPIYREWGWEMWQAIEKTCRTKYGYGHLRDVRKASSIEDRAESFFFAETAKYAYLLFKDEKIVDLTKKVFNTEAHPLTVFDK